MKTLTAFFNRFNIELPEQCAMDCSHSGRCDEDVEFWLLKLDTSTWPDPDRIKAELREYGAWSDDELQDVSANERRLLWLAAGLIKDEKDRTIA